MSPLPYILSNFFLPFRSFVPVFGLYCVRKFNLRFLMCPSSIYTLEVFLGFLYWTLAIFPCILFCYTFCQWLFENALAAFWDVLGSYSFLCTLLYHYSFSSITILLMPLVSLIFSKNISANIMYRIIDNGRPCRSPLFTRKSCGKCPFTLTCASMFW